jgi:hypothetical protein
MIPVAANILSAASYTIDVAFVQDFSPLVDGTVQATLADDYSKLIRPIAQALSQVSVPLTVN